MTRLYLRTIQLNLNYRTVAVIVTAMTRLWPWIEPRLVGVNTYYQQSKFNRLADLYLH